MNPFAFWAPKADTRGASRPAITIISGFLGAGKTTFLNHLLKSSFTERTALLVNDLGAVNIDAALVKNAVARVHGPIGNVVELTSGCICCSGSNQFMDAIVTLLDQYQPEHIIVEATGVADPRSILETLASPNMLGVRGIDFLRIANMITVVDAANGLRYLAPTHAGRDNPSTRRKHLHVVDYRRPLEELIFDQIECADVLLLNKIDAVSSEELFVLEQRIRALNPRADLFHTTFGACSPEAILGTERYDDAQTLAGSRWQVELNQSSFLLSKDTPHASAKSGSMLQGKHVRGNANPKIDYGFQSFVYHARRPFHSKRFMEQARTGFPNVLRAKGFFWSHDQPDRVGFLSIAGTILRADTMGPWWIARIQSGAISKDEIPEPVLALWWNDAVGDRRQELVLIGIDLNETTLRAKLDDCLV